MIASSIALEPILDKLREAGNGDLLRGILQTSIQALIDLEATQVIGAAPHERSVERTTQRNGHRSRELETRVGNLDLKIPKLRAGSYFPSLLQPRRMTEQALLSVIQEAYIQGISTRSVDKLAEALGLDGMDKSKVSRICENISVRVEEFRSRPVESEYLYLWFDATYIKVREGGRICSKAFIICIGLNTAGEREVVGFTIGNAESYPTWLEFLRSLVARGLRSPLLCISDANEGIKRACQEVFAGSSWQRCSVHYLRNVLSLVPRQNQQVVSAAVRQIYKMPDHQSALRMAKEIASKMEKSHPKVAEKLYYDVQETLNYMALPSEHWRQIHSTNGLERLNREAKRRADVVEIFPNDDAAIRLLGAVLHEQHDEWSVCRKVYSQESIAKALQILGVQEDTRADKAN
jgi:putative transposase